MNIVQKPFKREDEILKILDILKKQYCNYLKNKIVEKLLESTIHNSVTYFKKRKCWALTGITILRYVWKKKDIKYK